MVVILIIATITGIALQNYYATADEERLRSSLHGVSLEIRRAQHTAVLRGEEVVLRYDLGQNALFIEELPDIETEDVGRYTLEERRKNLSQNAGKNISEFYLDPGIVITKVKVGDDIHSRGNVPVLYGPDGVCESHRVMYHIKASDIKMALQVSGLLGTLRSIDPDRFDVKWGEAFDEEDPSLIAYDDFFPAGPPQPHQPEEQPGGGNP